MQPVFQCFSRSAHQPSLPLSPLRPPLPVVARSSRPHPSPLPAASPLAATTRRSFIKTGRPRVHSQFYRCSDRIAPRADHASLRDSVPARSAVSSFPASSVNPRATSPVFSESKPKKRERPARESRECFPGKFLGSVDAIERRNRSIPSNPIESARRNEFRGARVARGCRRKMSRRRCRLARRRRGETGRGGRRTAAATIFVPPRNSIRSIGGIPRIQCVTRRAVPRSLARIVLRRRRLTTYRTARKIGAA